MLGRWGAGIKGKQAVHLLSSVLLMNMSVRVPTTILGAGDSAGYTRPLIPRVAMSGMGEVVILKGIIREGNTEM